jgi:hypothetical protein
MSQTVPSIFTVKQFAEKHKLFSVPAIRYQILNADKNGLSDSGALIRVGRKVLLHEAKYFAWIESGAAK